MVFLKIAKKKCSITLAATSQFGINLKNNKINNLIKACIRINHSIDAVSVYCLALMLVVRRPVHFHLRFGFWELL